MSPLNFTEAEFIGKRKQTRREKFLNEMDKTIPWDYLAAEIAKHYPEQGRRGRPPYPIETMLRIHFMQQWFSLSDAAMEEALYDSHSMRGFVRLPQGRDAVAGLRADGAQGNDRERDDHQCAEFDKERRGRARSADAPDKEG